MTEQKTALEIRDEEHFLSKAELAILVPLDSPHHPEKLAGIIAGSKANAKHAFHTLSEIALVDFEDEEIKVEQIPEGRTIFVNDTQCDTPVEQGLVIFRDLDGKVRITAHDNVDFYRLLKFANRHCTRWVRLDI